MRRTTALFSGVLIGALLLPGVAVGASSGARESVIVVFDDSVPDVAAAAGGLGRQHGFRPDFLYRHALKGFAARMSSTAAAALARNPQIAWVEADGTAHLTGDQLNPTWGLDRVDERDLPLDGHYRYDTTGAGVNAYVIDSGIRFSHVDFGGRAVRAFDAIGDGQNGSDCQGHGTHVAGTIGGATYGVAKGVTLHSVRVFACQTTTTWSAIIAGVDWVTANHVKPAVANMSLGGPTNDAVDTAVRNSIATGVSYAIAAGNGDFLGRQVDACTQSPARVADAMTISGTNSNDSKISWANYGNCVDWFAPGASITSASHTSDSGTAVKSGTSMATPHTAGVAALYLQSAPSASPQTVRDALYAATTKGKVTSSSTANNHLLYNLNTGGGTPTNRAPVAQNDTSAAQQGLAVTISVLANDSDPDGNALRVTNLSDPPNGTVTLNSNQTVTYTSDAAFSGQDTFTYTANDGALDSNVATVTISVSGPSGGDPSVLHVGDLEGFGVSSGKTWTANVTVAVHDGTHAPVGGATVTGMWSNGTSGTGSCVTSPSGSCTIEKSGLRKNLGSVTFSVTGVSNSGTTYAAGENHDADGDSNGSTITVLKP